MAIRECPPSLEKSSLIPSSLIPSASSQTRAIRCSVSSRGASYCVGKLGRWESVDRAGPAAAAAPVGFTDSRLIHCLILAARSPGARTSWLAVIIAVFDFPIAVLPNDASPMDDTMKVAKALVRLLDGATHRADIRHTRVHAQNLAAQFLDSLDRADSRADGIIDRVAGDPCVPGL